MTLNRTVKYAGFFFSLSLLGLGVFFILAEVGKTPPLFKTVKERYKKSDALLLDRHGRIIHEMRVDNKGRRLEWVGLQDISPAFIQALLFVEDRRFYRHAGVDWLALAQASINNALSRRNLRGASTISMQLASLLDNRLKSKGTRKTIHQKWNQILTARALEKTWSKEQILEAYVNLISYRNELQGLSAASRGLFDKEPSGLTDRESLLLASLISTPNAPLDRIVQKTRGLAKSRGTPISDQALYDLAGDRFHPPYPIKPVMALAPHVARLLLKENRPQCRSTLDKKLQQFALETLDHQLRLLKDGHVSDGAVLILDNPSGEILAYVGNGGVTSSASYLDGITARRQAGSTLKPFLYGLAIEKGLLTASSLLDDSSLQVPTPTGLYVPKNYDNAFRGSVSVRKALSSSINIPAVRTLLLVGVNPFVDLLKRLGFKSLTEEGDYYGYSLALGSADVTLWELTNAYRTLANGGRWSDLKIQFDQQTSTPVPVLDRKTAFILSHILSDRAARSSIFGLENPLSTRFWTAVKTGTSKEMRDNWCLGFSDQYTVGVWVGNFSGEPMREVSGISGAAPIWMEMMNYLHRNRASKLPKTPTGIVRAQVRFDQDLEAPREECFIKGSEPVSRVGPNSHHQKPRIIYPAHETLISLDPEIPEDHQRIPFEFQPQTHRYEWVINNRKTGISDPFFFWKPQRGSYALSIVDPENRIIDSVDFLVR